MSIRCFTYHAPKEKIEGAFSLIKVRQENKEIVSIMYVG
jgi:hypothetical protein